LDCVFMNDLRGCHAARTVFDEPNHEVLKEP
jgi:hypothetical protein